MSIFSRLAVIAVVAAGVLSALVSGQSTVNQPNAGNTCSTTSPQCTELQMSVNGGGLITIGLTYDPRGDICSITSATIFGPNAQAANVGFVTANVGAATNKVTVGLVGAQEEILTISLGFTATYLSNGAMQTATGTVIGNVQTSGTTSLTFSPFFTNGAVSLGTGTMNQCTGGAAGDPLFKGFLGQQFYVEGKDGQVFNMLNTFNLQLNGRFVQLEEGAALYPYQQEKIQMESVIAHQAQPEVAAFPKTTAWNHPGTYFGEIGVALLGDNRVHAKAGSFSTGFAKVTLNGRNLPVSDDFVVLGSGSNTTFVQRVSAHELTIRTVNVEFSVVNSDNFLNIEHLHMERGSKKFSNFGGMLGKTNMLGWSFNTKDQEAAVVESNNLFERQTVEA